MNYTRRFEDRENAIPMEMEMNRKVLVNIRVRRSVRVTQLFEYRLSAIFIRIVFIERAAIFPIKIPFVLFVGGFSMKTTDERSWCLVAQCGSSHAE